MKLNNKGFSLVEVMMAVLISTIVFGAVTALIVYASNNVRLTNSRVSLQDQAKDAMNHIESYCLEAEGVSWDPALKRFLVYTNEADAKAVSKGAVSVSEVYSFTSNTYVYWMKDNKLYFGKVSSDKTETLLDPMNLPADDIYLLADYVEDFEVFIEKNKESGKYTVDVDMDFDNESTKYSCSKKVYYRNQ